MKTFNSTYRHIKQTINFNGEVFCAPVSYYDWFKGPKNQRWNISQKNT